MRTLMLKKDCRDVRTPCEKKTGELMCVHLKKESDS